MATLPRIGLGTVQRDADLQPLVWALSGLLQREGLQVQSFLARAYFAACDGLRPSTGLTPRHLDSWVMTQPVCTRVFARSAAACDISLVQGEFFPTTMQASKLDQLCDWLQLPKLAMVDVSQLSRCALPQRPSELEGLLLCGDVTTDELLQAQANFEMLWNVPVLGSLQISSRMSAALGELPAGARPTPDVIDTLARMLERRLDLTQLIQLSQSREFPDRPFVEAGAGPCRDVTIAVAYDDCFNCYFPDALDGLEQQGATLRVFSPLRDERLPEGTGIVYIGCGHPERFADELARNQCLMADLRQHVCDGKRIYAEGGGLAYLCRQIETTAGMRIPMVGALPAIARMQSGQRVTPIELTLRKDCWLGAASTQLRGYLNPAWSLEPTGPLAAYSMSSDEGLNLVGRHKVIGSRIHLNFAALPGLIDRFFDPCHPALDLVAARLPSD